MAPKIVYWADWLKDTLILDASLCYFPVAPEEKQTNKKTKHTKTKKPNKSLTLKTQVSFCRPLLHALKITHQVWNILPCIIYKEASPTSEVQLPFREEKKKILQQYHIAATLDRKLKLYRSYK